MDKSYKDLVELMEKHLHPPSSKLKYRHELFMAIATYAACLWGLGQHCAYSKSILSEMLRDAFTFGMNDVQF